MTEQEAAVVLSLVPGVKPALMREIHGSLGSFNTFFSAAPEALPAPWRALRSEGKNRRTQARDILGQLQEDGITLIPLSVDEYPALLREVHRPPVMLYVKGDAATLALPQIAIVGSRKASRSGEQAAEEFARALADAGFAITSGMALGIDGAAHRGALASGKTLAVLGCGVDVVYPRRHQSLYERIVDSGGAVVSEMKPGTRPLRQYFPQRNRIISGLSMGILIVEAATRSGSLITARLAMEQGREVFAIPGSIHNPMARGCHQLIREGAVLTETVDDIVSQLGGMLAFKAEEIESPALPCAPEQLEILQAMGFDPVDTDTLLTRLPLTVSQLTSVLIELEIQGLVESVGGHFRRLR